MSTLPALKVRLQVKSRINPITFIHQSSVKDAGQIKHALFINLVFRAVSEVHFKVVQNNSSKETGFTEAEEIQILAECMSTVIYIHILVGEVFFARKEN